jgi:hypothetical protein
MITITENLTTVTISVTQGQTGTQDISGKVDKIVGKGLSTEDYTTAEKTKLATLSNTGGTVDLSAYATIASVDLKVDKVTGKSLINDTEITRLATVTNFDNSVNVASLSNKVDKVAGKSLVSDTEITRLSSVVNFDNSTNITALSNKVDKVTGFSLTKNDFTDILKAKLDSITEIFTTVLKTSYDAAVAWVSTNGTNVLNHVSSTLNPHNVTKTQVGLSNVPNTDFTSAVAANTANLDLKVDKITGKGLSTEDYTTAEKTKLAGIPNGGSSIDTSNLAVQDGTVLYHTLPRFTPTGTISTVGTNVTISSTQFSSNTVGNKLTINGESRIITAFTNNTTVIVASAFSVNYTNQPLENWNVYSRAVEIGSNGLVSFLNNGGTTIARVDTGSNFSINGPISSLNNNFFLGSSGLDLRSDHTLRHSSTTSQSGTKDIGLRRNAAGIYEVYDGLTNTGLDANRRDLLVRNLISKSNFYASDAAADADTSLPSGAFYKITGSRGVNQKP